MLKINNFCLLRMQRVVVLGLLLPLVITGPFLLAQRFYLDDPLQKEPAPIHIEGADLRRLNEYVDFFESIFGKLGERHPENGIIPAQGVNTLGEVPNGPWYVNRHGQTRHEYRGAGPGSWKRKSPFQKGAPGRWSAQKRKE